MKEKFSFTLILPNTFPKCFLNISTFDRLISQMLKILNENNVAKVFYVVQITILNLVL